MEKYAVNSWGKKLITCVQSDNNSFKVDIMIIKKTCKLSYHITTFHDIVSMEYGINNIYQQDKNEALYDDLFISRE